MNCCRLVTLSDTNSGYFSHAAGGFSSPKVWQPWLRHAYTRTDMATDRFRTFPLQRRTITHWDRSPLGQTTPPDNASQLLHHVYVCMNACAGRGGLDHLAAWHLPGGPVGPASWWAVTSNVEVWVKRLTLTGKWQGGMGEKRAREKFTNRRRGKEGVEWGGAQGSLAFWMFIYVTSAGLKSPVCRSQVAVV